MLIGLIIFLSGAGVAGWYLLKSSENLVLSICIAVASLLLAIFQPYSFERIDAGNTGIQVKLTGNERGLTDYKYKTGWIVYNSWVEKVYEYPTYQQHIEYDEHSIITKGGFTTTIKPVLNYSLKTEAVGDMFVNLRLDLEQLQNQYLMNAIIGSVNDVANTWTIDSIFNHREDFELSIVRECNKRLNKWFSVSQLRTNITPPKELQEAITQKTKAIQEAQATMQNKLVAEAKAQEKIAIAKGDSADQVIRALAKEKVIKLEQNQLTPLYIEYLKVNKWNGENSQTVLGNNTSTMIQVK